MRKDLEDAFANAKKWGAFGVKYTEPEEIEPEIPTDAVVHAVAYGQSNRQSTVWVMSSQGLHVFRRGIVKSVRSGEFLPIHLISGISFNKSLLQGAGLKTSGPQSTEELIGVDTATGQNFAAKAKDILANRATASMPANGPAQSDPIDQIRKLASLLADGLITQEEFDAKKAKLLDI